MYNKLYVQIHFYYFYFNSVLFLHFYFSFCSIFFLFIFLLMHLSFVFFSLSLCFSLLLRPQPQQGNKTSGVQQNKSAASKSGPMGQSSILPLSDKELLKEWDFDRFFNNLNLNPARSSSSGSSESTKEKPGGTSRLRKHTRNGSVDASVISGLRRENSDFSLLLPRHSANMADHIRSSGVGGAKPQPVGGSKPSSIPEVKPAVASAAEVAPRRSASSLFQSFSKKINSGEWKPTRPRRERTDGDIILKNRANVWELRKNEVERRSELSNRSDTLRSNTSTLLTSRNRHSFIYDDQSQVRSHLVASFTSIPRML